MKLLLYPSGHGFGHASRDFQVVRAVADLAPDAVFEIRTGIDEWFVRHTLQGLNFRLTRASLDVGVIQANSLHQDIDRTRAACRALLAARASLLAQEIDFMRECRPDRVLCDVPAIPFAAARALDIPAYGMSNFSWDWIYSVFPDFSEISDAFAADYAAAAEFLRLPFHGGDEAFSAFRSVRDVPMVARRSALSVEEARARLGVDGRPLFLISFGGLGPSGFDWSALGALREYRFILTPPLRHGVPERLPDALTYVENDTLAARGLRYEDLVRACDGVVTKPGYGIVSEALANETRVLYTSRGEFAEYPFLVEALEKFGVARYISNDDLEAGRWADALATLMARPRTPCSLPFDGAEVTARHLTSSLP
ncbi:MAG: hypothetical protein FJX76_06295 [Armatimonadetes bacterium]|nr:hypothetical protein [Armatimonadota bacterium]